MHLPELEGRHRIVKKLKKLLTEIPGEVALQLAYGTNGKFKYKEGLNSEVTLRKEKNERPIREHRARAARSLEIAKELANEFGSPDGSYSCGKRMAQADFAEHKKGCPDGEWDASDEKKNIAQLKKVDHYKLVEIHNMRRSEAEAAAVAIYNLGIGFIFTSEPPNVTNGKTWEEYFEGGDSDFDRRRLHELPSVGAETPTAALPSQDGVPTVLWVVMLLALAFLVYRFVIRRVVPARRKPQDSFVDLEAGTQDLRLRVD